MTRLIPLCFMLALATCCRASGEPEASTDSTTLTEDAAPRAAEASAPGIPDANGNGRPDAVDIAIGYSLDENYNGIPDDGEILFHPELDRDGDGRLDAHQ